MLLITHKCYNNAMNPEDETPQNTHEDIPLVSDALNEVKNEGKEKSGACHVGPQ